MAVRVGRRVGVRRGTQAHHRRQRQALVPLRVGVLLQDPRIELKVRDGNEKSVPPQYLQLTAALQQSRAAARPVHGAGRSQILKIQTTFEGRPGGALHRMTKPLCAGGRGCYELLRDLAALGPPETHPFPTVSAQGNVLSLCSPPGTVTRERFMGRRESQPFSADVHQKTIGSFCTYCLAKALEGTQQQREWDRAL